MPARKSLKNMTHCINTMKMGATSRTSRRGGEYSTDSSDILDIPEGHRMSEEMTGLALRFGQHPALQWVAHLQQAAEMSSTAPTMIVIGLTQRPRELKDARRLAPGALLKQACVQLLAEVVGKPGAGHDLILRLESPDAIASAYTKYVTRTKRRRPLEPKVMFIGSLTSPTAQASFADKLREALQILDQVAGPDLAGHESASAIDDDDQLRLARERREQLLAQEKWLNAPEVHRQQGGKPDAQGVNNTASKARRAGGLLGAWDGREYLHPGFQFDVNTGRLMPEVKQLLDILPKDRSGWRQAFWLFQKHAQLDGRRPADVFQKNPSAVIKAARGDFVLDDERW